MPNIKSAKKRVLVNATKNERNTQLTSEYRTAIKKFRTAIETNNIELAEKLLPETISIIDGAATKGIITKSCADNHKSKLSKSLSDVKSGKKVIVAKKDNKTIAAEKRAEKLLPETISIIDGAATKGIITKSCADNHKRRTTRPSQPKSVPRR
ncbi:MAG: hypothetical protein BHW39_06070 [Firmicutes bacterium CAG:552_39_19]|nr:MAG: hypothetical protein BHW39_06070 [Firmicutes bacterium CAG:552_39_19]